MTHRRYPFMTAMAMLFALAAVACGAASESEDTTGSVSQAVDNETRPPSDGAVCYVDGPNVKPESRFKRGKIERGFCCVENDCYLCGPFYECEVGRSDWAVRA